MIIRNLVILPLTYFAKSNPLRKLTIRENNPRLLLAHLREGYFAHPGDTEAIDILLEHLEPYEPSSPLKILDVGCGRGGTADYIKNKNKTLNNVLSLTGIDIELKNHLLRLAGTLLMKLIYQISTLNGIAIS